MMCYVFAKQGLREEAVTTRVVCGMGLCMEHSIREELPVKDIVDWGFGEEEIKYPIPCLGSSALILNWRLTRERRW